VSLPALPADDERLAAMETELHANIKISDSDLIDLMEERARHVQSHLVESGRVGPERLFIITPKPPDASTKGESRVNLSLN
jgi:hypothetical protein